jgi:hypothetical protein
MTHWPLMAEQGGRPGAGGDGAWSMVGEVCAEWRPARWQTVGAYCARCGVRFGKVLPAPTGAGLVIGGRPVPSPWAGPEPEWDFPRWVAGVTSPLGGDGPPGTHEVQFICRRCRLMVVHTVTDLEQRWAAVVRSGGRRVQIGPASSPRRTPRSPAPSQRALARALDYASAAMASEVNRLRAAGMSAGADRLDAQRAVIERLPRIRHALPERSDVG